MTENTVETEETSSVSATEETSVPAETATTTEEVAPVPVPVPVPVEFRPKDLARSEQASKALGDCLVFPSKGVPILFALGEAKRTLQFGRPAPFASFNEFKSFFDFVENTKNTITESQKNAYILHNGYWQSAIVPDSLEELPDGRVRYRTEGAFAVVDSEWSRTITVPVERIHNQLWICLLPWVPRDIANCSWYDPNKEVKAPKVPREPKAPRPPKAPKEPKAPREPRAKKEPGLPDAKAVIAGDASTFEWQNHAGTAKDDPTISVVLEREETDAGFNTLVIVSSTAVPPEFASFTKNYTELYGLKSRPEAKMKVSELYREGTLISGADHAPVAETPDPTSPVPVPETDGFSPVFYTSTTVPVAS